MFGFYELKYMYLASLVTMTYLQIKRFESALKTDFK